MVEVVVEQPARSGEFSVGPLAKDARWGKRYALALGFIISGLALRREYMPELFHVLLDTPSWIRCSTFARETI